MLILDCKSPLRTLTQFERRSLQETGYKQRMQCIGANVFSMVTQREGGEREHNKILDTSSVAIYESGCSTNS